MHTVYGIRQNFLLIIFYSLAMFRCETGNKKPLQKNANNYLFGINCMFKFYSLVNLFLQLMKTFFSCISS